MTSAKFIKCNPVQSYFDIDGAELSGGGGDLWEGESDAVAGI